MVSVNVAQLLMSPPGTVREFDFSEHSRALDDELHLSGPITGYARLTRTSEGVLVHTEHAAIVLVECARCLDDTTVEVTGELYEEFLPTADVFTGAPVHFPEEEDVPRIDDHHEIDLNEALRQNILTNLPLQPLCEQACPGLCTTCGQRLDKRHRQHAEDDLDEDIPVNPANPFAQLAALMSDKDSPDAPER